MRQPRVAGNARRPVACGFRRLVTPWILRAGAVPDSGWNCHSSLLRLPRRTIRPSGDGVTSTTLPRPAKTVRSAARAERAWTRVTRLVPRVKSWRMSTSWSPTKAAYWKWLCRDAVRRRAPTFRAAREIKIRATAKEAARRADPARLRAGVGRSRPSAPRRSRSDDRRPPGRARPPRPPRASPHRIARLELTRPGTNGARQAYKTRMRRAVLVVVAIAVAALLAVPSVAKEGVRAKLDRPVRLDAAPGDTVRVRWHLVDGEGRRFGASGSTCGSPVAAMGL